ncbi:MAG: hypothetical protein AAFV80_22185, partial [Bacteroidota bacterium]
MRLCSLLGLIGLSISSFSQTLWTISEGVVVQQAGSINLDNTHWINNGSYISEANGSVMISGNGLEATTIGGNVVSTFEELVLNKTTSGARLEQSITINHAVVFQNGYLDLNGDTITLGMPDALIENETADNRIIGPNGGTIQMTIDLNAPSQVNPGNLGFEISSSANLGSTLVQREHVPVSLNDSLSINRSYKIFPTNNTDLDATIGLRYLESELEGYNESALGAWRKEHSFWYNPPSLNQSSSDRVTINQVDFLGAWTLAPNAPTLDVRVFLAGPYDVLNVEMKDELRNADLIPTTEPFSELGYLFPSSGGGEQVLPQVFNIGGSSAIVDWVLVELRDAADPATVLAARAGFVQKNGRIVDLDGRSPLSFPEVQTFESPRISIRHRNHVGIIAANATSLNNGLVVLDFTIDPDLAEGGSAAFIDFGNGHFGLISGDVNGDGQVQNIDFNTLTIDLGSSGYKT